MEKYYVIATIRKGSKIVGVRILRYNTVKNDGKCENFNVNKEIKYKIENAIIKNGEVKTINGSIDRYSIIEIDDKGKEKIKKETIFIIGTDGKKFVVCDIKGTIKVFEEKEVIKYAEKYGISNGQVKKVNGNKYIYSISGEYEKMIFENEEKQPDKKEKYNKGFLIDEELKKYVENKKVNSFNKRKKYKDLMEFICDNTTKTKSRICGLYGLRRTGKTTLLLQAIDELLKQKKKVAYITFPEENNVNIFELYEDIEKLIKNGYKYIFLDEITYVKDFDCTANKLSDVYACECKIIVSGTDSFILKMAEGDALLDRIKLIHTTYIGYKEYVELYPERNIIDYIHNGGVLDINSSYIEEHCEEYIQSSICNNIKHTLEKIDDETQYPNLHRLLCNKPKLTNMIENFIKNSNKEFLVDTLYALYEDGELKTSIKSIIKSDDNEITEINKSDIKEFIDKNIINQEVREKMGINEEYNYLPNEREAKEIYNILKLLDIFTVYKKEDNEGIVDVILFTQPGLRFQQIKRLLEVLHKNKGYVKLTIKERNILETRIINHVEGILIEHTIIATFLEAKNKNNIEQINYNYENSEGRMISGEWDIVEIKAESFDIYEVKRNNNIYNKFGQWLVFKEMCDYYEKRYGIPIEKKTLLYMGEDKEQIFVDERTKNEKREEKISCKNIDKYLQEMCN